MIWYRVAWDRMENYRNIPYTTYHTYNGIYFIMHGWFAFVTRGVAVMVKRMVRVRVKLEKGEVEGYSYGYGYACDCDCD